MFSGIFKDKKLPPVICGCKTMQKTRRNRSGSDGITFTKHDKRYRDCCKTSYMGIVYNKLPSGCGNNLCQPCTKQETGEDGKCITVTTKAPHGRTQKRLAVMCSKLLVYSGAVTTGSQITKLKENLYRSRGAEALPFLEDGGNAETCQNPMQCPAENRRFKCCRRHYIDKDGKRRDWTEKIAGPWKNCSIDCVEFAGAPYQGDPGNECSGNKGQIYSMPLSPCLISEGTYEESENFDLYIYGKTIMSGYASDGGWWFLDSSEFMQQVLVRAAQIDPYADTGIKHSIVMHFTCVTRRCHCCCCNFPCGATKCQGSPNKRASDCGSGCNRVEGADNKDVREKNVRIYAFIGFADDFCGYTPTKACEKLYEA